MFSCKACEIEQPGPSLSVLETIQHKLLVFLPLLVYGDENTDVNDYESKFY